MLGTRQPSVVTLINHYKWHSGVQIPGGLLPPREWAFPVTASMCLVSWHRVAAVAPCSPPQARLPLLFPPLFEFADPTFQAPSPAPAIPSTQTPFPKATRSPVCQHGYLTKFSDLSVRQLKTTSFGLMCIFRSWVGWASSPKFRSHLHFVFCEQSASSLGPFSMRLLKLIIYTANQFSVIGVTILSTNPHPMCIVICLSSLVTVFAR